MADHGHLLDRLTADLTKRDASTPLSRRLCESFRDLAGADGAAITVQYGSPNRVTLCATDEVAVRLEDLQDVLGEGPGHSASESGRIELCAVPANASSRWTMFVEAAQDLVEGAVIHAVPMHPASETFGVITLYQRSRRSDPLALKRPQLQFLADVVGAALVRDSMALGDVVTGPWASRAAIHQATGMVVAQLHVSPDDALALLRAHAFAQQVTLTDIASAVVARRLAFPIS